jgi:hypothetical protein
MREGRGRAKTRSPGSPSRPNKKHAFYAPVTMRGQTMGMIFAQVKTITMIQLAIAIRPMTQ